MSFQLKCLAGTTQDFVIDLLWNGNAATPVTLAAGDIVRVKVGHADSTPELDLSSIAPTANGSGVTIDTLSPASVTLRLAQGDTANLAGTYDIEVNVVDVSETVPPNAIKAVEYGALAILASET